MERLIDILRSHARGASRFHERTESGHDRFERRRVSIVAAPRDASDMPGLVVVGRGSRAGGEDRVPRPPSAARRAGLDEPGPVSPKMLAIGCKAKSDFGDRAAFVSSGRRSRVSKATTRLLEALGPQGFLDRMGRIAASVRRQSGCSRHYPQLAQNGRV